MSLLAFVRVCAFVSFAGEDGGDAFLRPPKPSHLLSGEVEVDAAAAAGSGDAAAAGAPPSLMLFSPAAVRPFFFFSSLLASRAL